mmetsp:Transcript_37051/g.80970  ORF Transcript_37051/g.80970 Transcript_37051/m.80970 type:complete len:483 (+) Transcript_37051:43-1491(+)
MSWRAECTLPPTSALNEDEKNFLKSVKKLRDVFKLEEKKAGGARLEANQQGKIDGKQAIIDEIAGLARRLPVQSSLWEKNPDVVALLPDSALERRNKAMSDTRAAADRRDKDRQDRERERASRPERARARTPPTHQTRHDRPVTRLTISPDGNFFYTSSKDKMILVWDVPQKGGQHMKARKTYAGHDGAVWGVDCCLSEGPNKGKLLSGSADGKICLWPGVETLGKRAEAVAPLATLDHGGIVKFVEWSLDDNSKFVSCSYKLGSSPPFIAVWSLDGTRSTCLVKIEKMPARANEVRWGAPGGRTKLFSCHDNGYIAVWDAENGDLLKTLPLHKDIVTQLNFDFSRKVLLTASADKTALAVDVSTPAMATLKTYSADRPINAIAVPPTYLSAEATEEDNQTVAIAGGRDPRDVTTSKLVEGEFDVLILGADQGDKWSAGKGHFGPVHCIRYFQDGLGFASCGEDGCVKVYNADGSIHAADTL